MEAEDTLNRKEIQPPVGRDIHKLFLKLFVGKEQAGSITEDETNITIKLKTAILTDAQEDQLVAFMSQHFTVSLQPE